LILRCLPLALFLVACGDDSSPADAGSTSDARAPDAAADGGTDPGPDAGEPIRVLFVGNSYTDYNDLPSVVRALGAANGAPIESESILLNGGQLADHWLMTGARERVQAGGLDAVVMQGQSVEPILDAKSFYGYATEFANAIDASGAEGVWYATWARRAGDTFYADTGYTPESMTTGLENGYEFAARMHGDPVARVGAAFQIALAEIPGVELYMIDGSHPSPAGTLLAACVITQAITGEAPAVPDPAPLEIPVALATELCAIAPRVRCDTTEAFCDGACVDAQFNAQHCGGCGACPGTDPCRFGVCGCDPGFTGCEVEPPGSEPVRLCVDTAADTSHCGGCGIACDAGEVCAGGDCACPLAGAQPMTVESLAAGDGCEVESDRGGEACNAAAHAYCASFDCFTSGFGSPTGHAPMVDELMCVSGEVRETTYTALAALVPACDGVAERASQSCATAIHRFCVSTGAASGFGPLASEGDAVTVTCLPSATIARTTMATLQTFISRCVPDASSCSAPAWSYCASLGHAGGFGPVEIADTDADVVCLDH
jgi:hypothetical protein